MESRVQWSHLASGMLDRSGELFTYWKPIHSSHRAHTRRVHALCSTVLEPVSSQSGSYHTVSLPPASSACMVIYILSVRNKHCIELVTFTSISPERRCARHERSHTCGWSLTDIYVTLLPSSELDLPLLSSCRTLEHELGRRRIVVSLTDCVGICKAIKVASPNATSTMCQ